MASVARIDRRTLMFAAAALAKHGARVAAVQPAADPEAPPPAKLRELPNLRPAATPDVADARNAALRVLGSTDATRVERRAAMRTLKKLSFVRADTRLAAFAGLRGGG